MQDLIFEAQHLLDPIGTPGVRDKDAPCQEFQPGIPLGNCETDGHYLCAECTKKKKKDEKESSKNTETELCC
jgi:hypothetical protein